MSAAKDSFYEILVPRIEAHGFEFKKSKTTFMKIENGLEYQIKFHWDGRGGTTMLDSVEVFVDDLEIRKAIKNRTKRPSFPHVFSGWGYSCFANPARIPVMYSKATLDLANNMNFKALSLMPQDEKYPPDRILNSANFVEELIVNEVFTFFNQFKNRQDIYDYLLKRVENEGENMIISENVTDVFKGYAEALDIPLIPQMSEPTN